MSSKPPYRVHDGGPDPLPDGDRVLADGQERFAAAYARNWPVMAAEDASQTTDTPLLTGSAGFGWRRRRRVAGKPEGSRD